MVSRFSLGSHAEFLPQRAFPVHIEAQCPTAVVQSHTDLHIPQDGMCRQGSSFRMRWQASSVFWQWPAARRWRPTSSRVCR